MTQEELYAVLVSLGLPVAYGEFKSTPQTPAPSPPFICYQFVDSDDLIADDVNTIELSNYWIELYTVKKDKAREKLIEDMLKSYSLPYYKHETWIDTEKMRQVIYEIQLTGG